MVPAWNDGNMREAILAYSLLDSLSFLTGDAGRFTEFMLVITPQETEDGVLPHRLKRDEFGFASFVDCVAMKVPMSYLTLAPAKKAIPRVTRSIREAFPTGDRPYRISVVVDVDYY